jgi:hypothetical protein
MANIKVRRLSCNMDQLKGRLLRTMSYLGEGYYASVWRYKGFRKMGRVVKLVSGSDASYRAYVRAILRAKPGNPWLPRIYSATRVILTGEIDRDVSARTWQRRRHYTALVVEMEELVCRWSLPAGTQPNFTHGEVTCNRAITLTEALEARGMPIDDYAAEAQDIFYALPGTHDCHENNVMFRECGQLVFTDPVS